MDKSPDAFRTISEVSDWLDTPAHVLRFWESRFTQLKPVKRAGGRRYYRPGDMALLGGIKKLLHDDGLTIRGVQKILREQGVRYVATLGPETLAPGGDAADAVTLAPRTADIVLDEAEYGTPEVIVAWQQDKIRDSGRATPPSSQPDEAPEAPMHLDAPEVIDTPLTAALYTLPHREALAEIPAEELADLEFGLSESEDMAIPEELEGEWAAILAEEAAARVASPPLHPQVQPDLFSLDEEEAEAAANPDDPDRGEIDLPGQVLATSPIAAADAPSRSRPVRDLPADTDPGPGPVSVAMLVRHMQASKSLVQAAQLRPLYARLVEMRKRRNLPVATDRQ
jgi:resuscitation-promoting factor RpfA